MDLHPVIATVTFLKQMRSASCIGTATGFFFKNEKGLFLVTNRHVVQNEEADSSPDTLRLLLHRSPNNITDNDTYDISLYSSEGNPLWKEHPASQIADVILLKLDEEDIQSQFFIKAWSTSDFLPNEYILSPGEDVFVIGYPRGFFDVQHNLPIFRNAMIASTYGVPFQGKPCFLTDANLHRGTSGSPVVTKPKNTWRDSKGNIKFVSGIPYYILGIHSGTYSVLLPESEPEPLGLGNAWYIQLIEEIAKSF